MGVIKHIFTLFDLILRFWSFVQVFCFDTFVAANVICKTVNLIGTNNANTNGYYQLTDDHVAWAPERPVYKHVSKNRYMFYNIGVGWSIGSAFETGGFFYTSKLYSKWQYTAYSLEKSLSTFFSF